MYTFKKIRAFSIIALACLFAQLKDVSAATWISAEGFYSMYRLAAQGDVEALRTSDLPIDGVNRNEDTGLCYSARRRNVIAWNAYLDAGANPYPECAGRVPGYEEFARSARILPPAPAISGTAIAYGLGAAALIGGGIALASGGGGGGGGGSKNCSAYPYEECPTGYHEVDHCQEGDVTKYKCEINDCSDYPYTACATGYHEVDHCQEGDVTKYKCEINNCSDYPYTECGTGYHEVGHCQEGNVTKYQCEPDECGPDYQDDPCDTEHGWDQVSTCPTGGTIKYKCKAHNCGSSYGNTPCSEGYTQEECWSGGVEKYKCTKTPLTCLHDGSWSTTLEKCVCVGLWEGDTCETCPSGDSVGDTCYPEVGCVHGKQVGGVCKCYSGWGGSHCDEIVNNINSSVTGASIVGTTSTITKINTGNENTSGLIYVIPGAKAGVETTLYNGFYETDAEHDADTDQTWIINVTNTGTGETWGMYNNEGDESCHLHVDGTNTALNATYTAQTNVTASGAGGNAYGIYSVGNVTTMEGVNYEDAIFNSLISVNSSGLNKTVYGIYSAGSVLNNVLATSTLSTNTLNVVQTNPSSATEVYGIKATNGVTNEGIISVKNDGIGTSYGIFSQTGSISNTGSLAVTSTGSDVSAAAVGLEAPEVTNTGKVVVDAAINTTGQGVYGVKASTFTNTTDTSGIDPDSTDLSVLDGIHVTLSGSDVTSDRSVYGIYASSTGANSIYNRGLIDVMIFDETDGKVEGYGIYSSGNSSSQILNDTTGFISVLSSRSVGAGRLAVIYGIYADGGTVINKGNIIMKATTAPGEDEATMYGIYATGSGTVVNNQGKIMIQTASNYCTGNECSDPGYGESAFIKVMDGATVNNEAQIIATRAMRLSGNVLLSRGGSFEAPSISGEVGVDVSAVSEGFENTYTLSDAIIAEDTTDLTLASRSVLFEASLDGQDVVLNKKDFNEVVEDSTFADFLEDNYALQNNEALYAGLKASRSVARLNSDVKDLMGEGLKRFASEDMMMIKELSFDMNNAMFANKKAEFTLTGNTQPISFEKNLGSRTRWSLSGKKVGKISYGVGVAFTDIRSQDSSKENRRTDEMFQMVMPIGYEAKGFEFITSPRLGYAYGHYTRDGYMGQNYDGKVEKRIYGVGNEVRYPIDVKGWKISPKAEFNAIGYQIKGHEEDKAFALEIGKQNIMSIEGGVGFNVGKEIEFGENHKLKFDSSVMMYHEFVKPYELELSMKDMRGIWKIRDEKRRDERIMLKNGFEYKFEDFALYGDWYSYIDSEYRTKADIGFKYHF